MTRKPDQHHIVALPHAKAATRHTHIAAFRAYWTSMRCNGDVPRRSDIDPRGIEPLLGNALIAERVAPGLARLRIAGTHLSDLMGMEVRGMPISAFIDPADRDRLASLLSDLFERPARVTLHLDAAGGLGRPALTGQMELLPLRSDLGDISRALGCLVTSGLPGRTPRRFRITSAQVMPVDVMPVEVRPVDLLSHRPPTQASHPICGW